MSEKSYKIHPIYKKIGGLNQKSGSIDRFQIYSSSEKHFCLKKCLSLFAQIGQTFFPLIFAK